jgi:hypothetical protein
MEKTRSIQYRSAYKLSSFGGFARNDLIEDANEIPASRQGRNKMPADEAAATCHQCF